MYRDERERGGERERERERERRERGGERGEEGKASSNNISSL